MYYTRKYRSDSICIIKFVYVYLKIYSWTSSLYLPIKWLGDMPVKLKNNVSFIWIAVHGLSWSMRSDRSCWRQKECKEVEMQKEFKWKQDKSFLRDMYLLRAMWYGYHRKLPMLCKQKQYISWVVAKKKSWC